MASEKQIEAAQEAIEMAVPDFEDDVYSREFAERISHAATAPLLQEISALKGELKLEDLPPESKRTKLDEWQACYAALFRQMQEAITQQAPLLEAVREAYAFLDNIKSQIEYCEQRGSLEPLDSQTEGYITDCSIWAGDALAKLKPFMEQEDGN